MQDKATAIVRRMRQTDLEEAAGIHRAAFTRQRKSMEWIRCCLLAAPRILCYVAVVDGKCVGYCLWQQKSGFRPEVVLELDQIAVTERYRDQGFGRQLIEDSLADAAALLTADGCSLKHVVVTTRADNHAQLLYRRALGAETEAVISNLYSADEVLMVARNIKPRPARPAPETQPKPMEEPT